jgi:hypothetical protein
MPEERNLKSKLSDEQVQELIKLRETTNFKWPEIGKQFGISGEEARRYYRSATGTLNKSYTDQYAGGGERNHEKTEYEQGDNFINIACSSKRMLSKEDIIEEFKIDLNEWEIKSYKIKTSEGYRKDRKVEWHIANGAVSRGDVSDTGKMLVVPLYHIEVRLIKKIQEIQIRSIFNDLIKELKKFSPVHPKIIYSKIENGLLFEPAIFDAHIGRLTWDEETGENYDLKIAEQMIKSAILKHLSMIKELPVSRILLPLGNDFLNVDNKFNTTSKGTPQQEDTRWQKTFKKGWEICSWMIDVCSQIALLTF